MAAALRLMLLRHQRPSPSALSSSAFGGAGGAWARALPPPRAASASPRPLLSPRTTFPPSPLLPPPPLPLSLPGECRFLQIKSRGGLTFHGHGGGGLTGGDGQSFSKSGAAFKGAKEVKGLPMIKELVAYIWPKDNTGIYSNNYEYLVSSTYLYFFLSQRSNAQSCWRWASWWGPSC